MWFSFLYRPLTERQKKRNSVSVVEILNDQKLRLTSSRTGEEFEFDRIFNLEAANQQEKIYDVVLAPILRDVLAGHECTVFDCGQKGTAKTYTVEGERHKYFIVKCL